MPVVTLTKSNVLAYDAYIDESTPSTNYGGSSYTNLKVGNDGNGKRNRTLIYFDMGLIPNDAIINSATLKLYCSSAVAGLINFHRITGNWGETGVTWDNAPSFDSTPLDQFNGSYLNGYMQFDVKNTIQNLVNNGGFGILIKNDEVGTSSQKVFISFNSSVNKPELVVDYTIPSTGKKCVEYVGSGAVAAFTTTSTIPIPAGAQAGDLLVIQALVNGAGAMSLPSDWTVQLNSTTNSYRNIVLTKTMVAGEVAPSFTPPSTLLLTGRMSAYRNVKAIQVSQSSVTGNGTAKSPPQVNATSDNTMFAIFNSIGANTSFTPALSFTEGADNSNFHTHQEQHRYMYEKRTLTTTEMQATAAVAGSGFSHILVLEPITNNTPTLTLTSPADNQVLSEGSGSNTLSVSGSATDVDSGNVVTIKYKINNGPTRALQSGVSNGSTPISFARSLTYANKRLWDGSTDVAGADLAEGVDHILTVWSEDDKGGKSAEVTRQFKVIWNRPPVIDGSNGDLGTILVPPEQPYTVTEPESDAFTVTEKINGMVIRSFAGTAGQQETITIPHDLWIRLDLDTPHTLSIEATDSKGMTATRTYTFVRTETHIEFLLNYDNPDVSGLFTLDGMPERVLFTLERYLPPGSDIESVMVCNNFLDAEPTWEDATVACRSGRGYLFTNTAKIADDWAICVWVIVAKGTATQRVLVDGYGGGFD